MKSQHIHVVEVKSLSKYKKKRVTLYRLSAIFFDQSIWSGLGVGLGVSAGLIRAQEAGHKTPSPSSRAGRASPAAGPSCQMQAR